MKILLIDIETAPNLVWTWGLFNQNIGLPQIKEPGYILCWAAKWLASKEMLSATLWGGDKESMLTEMYNLISEADVIIHYNGLNFDIRWLNTEFMSMGLPPPSPSQHIDLLQTVKSRIRLTSNKMDFALDYFNIGKKYEHDGFKMWVGVMEGDPHYQKEMLKYNKMDVSEMEKLYIFLRPWILNHPNPALYAAHDGHICTTCGSANLQKRGDYYTSVMRYQRWRCNSCGSWSKSRHNNLDKETRANVLKGI
jgi:DNA-directed RNA polymerase subunit RPC12/RpoP